MADNTRVNELQEKLLKAMDILNTKALSSVGFDKTIICTIVDDSEKDKGKYEVSNGSSIFSAYSESDKYKNNDSVYVTIPQGEYANQKMIIGKKTVEEEKPFNYKDPFDSFFSITGNIASGKGQLLANDVIVTNNKTNALQDCLTNVIIFDKDVSDIDLCRFPKMGVKADFKSWVKNATIGDYGINIILTTQKNGKSTEDAVTSTYAYTFNNSMMYGNTYKFETYYNQEVLVDLSNIDIDKITHITVQFYQMANFYDMYRHPVKSSDKGYLTDEQGLYQKYDTEQAAKAGYYKINGEKLSDNLFVDNLEIHFGYDISVFGSDYVEVYTDSSNSYIRSTKVDNDYSEENKKDLKVRWVHITDDGPIDMVSTANKDKLNELKYEVRWYRYHAGKAAADAYCGIYWERIEGAEDFQFIFNPDVNWQQERIKVIIIQDDNIPYRSNELIFTNDENVKMNDETLHIMNALVIECEDGTNGNYMFYGQDHSLKDSAESKMTRKLLAYLTPIMMVLLIKKLS